MSALTAAPSHAATAHADNGHSIPLWGLFLALLVLTAAEVALFEVWSHSNLHGTPFMPKFAMVLLLLTMTLPKAAIVMIYFMHLKFEKQLVVLLAVTPLLTAGIAVLVPLTDAKTLKGREQTYNIVAGLGAPPAGHQNEEGDVKAPAAHEAPKDATDDAPKAVTPGEPRKEIKSPDAPADKTVVPAETPVGASGKEVSDINSGPAKPMPATEKSTGDSN